MPLPWQSGSSNSMRAEPMAAARTSVSVSSGRVDPGEKKACLELAGSDRVAWVRR